MPASKLRISWVWLLVSVLAVASAAALAVWRERSARAGLEARLAKLTAENSELRAGREQLGRDIGALQAKLLLGSESAAPEIPGRRPAAVPKGAPDATLLQQLRDSLAAASASIGDLQLRNGELEAATEKIREENRALSLEQAELKDKLASVTRVLEAVQTELKTRNERVTQLEIAARTLREQNREATAKLEKQAQLYAELEEITRRRDNYLTSLIRRFRDTTEQYRVLAGRMEKPGEGALPSGPDLSRIQSTIALAEDDLRQVNNLNSQAARLVKQIKGN